MRYKIKFYTKYNELSSLKVESKEVADRIQKEMVKTGLKVVGLEKTRKD